MIHLTIAKQEFQRNRDAERERNAEGIESQQKKASARPQQVSRSISSFTLIVTMYCMLHFYMALYGCSHGSYITYGPQLSAEVEAFEAEAPSSSQLPGPSSLAGKHKQPLGEDDRAAETLVNIGKTPAQMRRQVVKPGKSPATRPSQYLRCAARKRKANTKDSASEAHRKKGKAAASKPSSEAVQARDPTFLHLTRLAKKVRKRDAVMTSMVDAADMFKGGLEHCKKVLQEAEQKYSWLDDLAKITDAMQSLLGM